MKLYMKLEHDSEVITITSAVDTAATSSDEIHELIISNDLPPGYNTLKFFDETPPPSYFSTLSGNHVPFLAVSVDQI